MSSPVERAICRVRVFVGGQAHTLATLIDSGSDLNFMDEDLVQQLGIQIKTLPDPIRAHVLDGRPLEGIRHQSVPVRMVMAGNHHETVQFYVLQSPRHPLVLGYPWLRRHNPHIDWTSGVILSWSQACHQVCLKDAAPGSAPAGTNNRPDLSRVPEEYHDLWEVFSKAKATSLPPHRPYDCAIDLLPGTSPPRGWICSLSGPERKAMERYVSESLAAGLNRPHRPQERGFFL